MNYWSVKISLLVSGSLLAMSAPGSAFAANTAQPAEATGQAAAGNADSQPSGGEIVVTATRQGQRLKDVPLSVNVATGEQLEKLNIFDAKDIQQLAPGLELSNNTGRNNTTTLRGISFNPDQGTAPAVQVYFNEIPVDAQTVYTAIYDIQQVEVLRGPQGLLRGLSAPAGAITFATRKPSFDQIEGYVQATATSRAGYNVQGGVTLPLSDSLALRVATLVDGNRVNHVRNVNRNGDRSFGRTESARATLGYRPSDGFEAYLTYQYLTADTTQYQQVVGSGNTPSYGVLPFIGVPVLPSPDTSERSGPPLSASDYGAVSEGSFRLQNSTHLINLQTSYDFGPATLAFVGGHQYTVLDTALDQDRANAVPNYIDQQTIRTPYKVDTGELRLTTNNREGLGFGVGAFYQRQTGTTVVNQNNDNFFFPTSVVNTPAVIGGLPYLPVAVNVTVPVSTKTWSFNANARFRSGPLTIEGGVRYSIYKFVRESPISISSPGYPLFAVPAFNLVQEGIPARFRNQEAKPWTGGATATFEITPAINAYAAYGRSFRAGSVAVAAPNGLDENLIVSDNEKSQSYEIGLKGSVFDRKVNFTIAAFHQKIDGFLSVFENIYYNCSEINGTCTNSPPAPPINNAVDAPNGVGNNAFNTDAKIDGIEGTIDARITRNWDLGLSASYIRARFDNALIPCNDFAGTGVPNEQGTPRITGTGSISLCRSKGRLSETPDFSLTANSEVRAEVGGSTAYLRGLFTYRPGFKSQRIAYTYASRELLNLFLGLRSTTSGWDFNVFVRNALGQNRITNITGGNAIRNTASGLPYDSGYRLVNTMAPREFGLTASYNF